MYMQADTIWGAARNAWLSKQPGHAGALSDSVLDENPDIGALNSHKTLVYQTDRKLIAKLEEGTRIRAEGNTGPRK